MPEFSSLDRPVVLTQGLRRFRCQWSHCGSCPTGPDSLLFSRQGAETPAAGILEFGPRGCPFAGSPQVPVSMVTLR